jgi:uncharacterized protein YfaQ (DUF2300 family)
MLVLFAPLVYSQGAPYRAPRLAGGRPDLNGIWQALNEANFDLEAHSARPAMAVRPGHMAQCPRLPWLRWARWARFRQA